ncbi:CsbD family protein [Xanthomonas melonis]|uniref:CsbD family protein n=1 Tax=Xanthomonas melonis TaxID=56456 RepID=A0ABS8NQF3_9XANT|nr:CsbD family protein [Xanthomonas melonis]MCD0256935.1 CsbD family protein [Xanthomonas melonis]MCD0265197.1 CsbD family protein [Xanthomonas melonis]
MDKNRIEGAAKQVKGSVKEAVGRVTGNRSTELEGAAEKNIGKVQRKAGEVADKVRDAWKQPRH